MKSYHHHHHPPPPLPPTKQKQNKHKNNLKKSYDGYFTVYGCFGFAERRTT